MWNDLKRFVELLVGSLHREEGQAMVEYSLILALISVVAILVLTGIGTEVLNALTSVSTLF